MSERYPKARQVLESMRTRGLIEHVEWKPKQKNLNAPAFTVCQGFGNIIVTARGYGKHSTFLHIALSARCSECEADRVYKDLVDWGVDTAVRWAEPPDETLRTSCSIEVSPFKADGWWQ